jgi:hypothetical protein
MGSSIRRRIPFCLLITAVVLHAGGCSDTYVGPAESSAISIGLTISGVDTDENFVVSLDGVDSRPLSPSAGLVLRSVASGSHSITLSGFRDHCILDGANPVLVDAPAGGAVTVDFSVTCRARSGVIAVTATVSGLSTPLWFGVQVDSERAERMRGNQETAVGFFPAGEHVVRLLDLPSSCTVLGDAAKPVSVRAGGLTRDTTVVSFALECNFAPPSESETALVAFERDGNVALVREGETNPVVVTDGYSPSWSPDGQYLVFQKNHCALISRCDDVWMIRPDGSGEGAITNGEGFLDYDPAVSPDGRSVAFIRFWHGPDQNYLMVSDLNGGAPVILSIWDPYESPTWSPDGRQIAFTCQGPAPTWELDLCVVKLAAGCASYFVNVCNGLPALEHLTSSRYVESDPAWSPDGDRIAFTLGCSSIGCPPGVTGDAYIALLDPVTRRVTPMVPGHSPTWSRDGKRIFFVGNVGDPGLRVINLDGTGLKSITHEAKDRAPSVR